MADLWQDLSAHISRASGAPFSITDRRDVGGGCINRACMIAGGARRYFVKLNGAGALHMFTAEAAGLEEIARSGALKVPRPLCWGTAAGTAYLVMDYLELGVAGGAAAAALGRHLAVLHRVTGESFGWHRDNTIGATPQINSRCADWPAFWRRHRLGYQLQMAAANGYGGRLQRDGEKLLAAIPALFAGHTPQPALVHGDLWAGNWSADHTGTPVVFDPAVYFGDRETDIAMTELFGGFPGAFYTAYRAEYPLDPGYEIRKTLYNLYHVLNHLNLFGASYLSRAQHMVAMLLSEIR